MHMNESVVAWHPLTVEKLERWSDLAFLLCSLLVTFCNRTTTDSKGYNHFFSFWGCILMSIKNITSQKLVQHLLKHYCTFLNGVSMFVPAIYAHAVYDLIEIGGCCEQRSSGFRQR